MEKKKNNFFRVSRVYCQRWTWTVEADNEKEALALLDNDLVTPFDEAGIEKLGEFNKCLLVDLLDEAKKL